VGVLWRSTAKNTAKATHANIVRVMAYLAQKHPGLSLQTMRRTAASPEMTGRKDMKPTASPRGCGSIVPIKGAEETGRSNFFYEAARKVRTGPELELHESTKRATKPCFAALEANIEAPDTTLDPFRTVSKLDFGHYAA
jgi:hypothetical protein